MKKQGRFLIAVLMMILMAVTFAGCGQQAADEEGFSGKLIVVQGDRIVVRGDTATMQFITTDATEFTFSGERQLVIGDEVEVVYQESGGKFIADEVRVTKHEEQLLVMGGEVTDMTDSMVTIRSENLTVGFSYDQGTLIEGNLSKGDIVAVTYKGNISVKPYAVSIVVAEDMQEQTLTTIKGTISEVRSKSVLLSIDSADACRFKINSDTIVSGDDTKMKVGDRATITYTGEIGKDALARSVKITREKKKEETQYVIDGTICLVEKGSITIDSGKKTYSFRVKDDTKIYNSEYMKPDHRTTITYTGKLSKGPKARVIYCSKETVKKEKDPTKATKKTKETKKETKATKETKKATKATRKTESQTVEPTETNEPTETGETETGETETGEPTETGETETGEPTESDPPTETDPPTEEVTEAPTEEQTEAPTEAETQATEDAEDITEPEEDTADDMIIVKANGTIKTWDGGRCKIKVEGAGTLELDTTDASIASGYFPQSEDEVTVSYDKTDMKMLGLQLIYRPAEE